MRIEAATLDLSASRQAHVRRHEEARLQSWVGDQPRAPAASSRPPAAPTPDTAAFSRLSEGMAARRAAAPPPPPLPHPGDQTGVDIAYTDEQREILTILEKVFGMKTTAATVEGAPAAAENATSADTQAEPDRAGWGLAYDYVRHVEDFERTELRADGAVRTADGRELTIAFSTAMERLHVEHEELHLRAGDAAPIDPLVLDLGGRGLRLDGTARVGFDLDGDGSDEQLAGLGPGLAFLALDRDRSGTIDHGGELFGPASGDGFTELARYDDDGNGWIDEADAVWRDLAVFRPDPAGSGILQPLAQAGVGAIALTRAATPFAVRDQANQDLAQVRQSSLFLFEDGRAGGVHQLDFYA